MQLIDCKTCALLQADCSTVLWAIRAGPPTPSVSVKDWEVKLFLISTYSFSPFRQSLLGEKMQGLLQKCVFLLRSTSRPGLQGRGGVSTFCDNSGGIKGDVATHA